MPIIQIFRAGTHTTSAGQSIVFSENDIANTALMYNSAGHSAPVVLGHPADDQPALAWVESLARCGGALVAKVGRLSPALVEAVRGGRYKYLSASFHSLDSPGNPSRGVWYLKHVGMLGAHPPAIKGLGPVAFADGTGPQSVMIGAAEFSDAGLWAGLPGAHEIPQQAVVEFCCASGFTADPVSLKIHQAALIYQRAHGVPYLDAVRRIENTLLGNRNPRP